jgi:hypothetical protein
MISILKNFKGLVMGAAKEEEKSKTSGGRRLLFCFAKWGARPFG